MVHEIKSRSLYRALHNEGIDNVILCKDNGYFFIASDDSEMAVRIASLPETSIYRNSFNDDTIEGWVWEIKRLLNQRFV